MSCLWRKAIGLVFLACALPHKAESCGHDWLSFDDQCIYISGTIKKSNYEANASCRESGAELVSIVSEDMLEFIAMHTYSYHPDTKFWVGLFIQNSTGYHLRWENGNSGEELWVRAQPWSVLDTPSQCFIYNGSEVRNEDCANSHAFICNREQERYFPEENCLHDVTKHSFIGEETGHCLFRTPTATIRENVDALCAQHGGSFLDLEEVMREGLTAFHEHRVLMDDGYRYWTALTVNGSKLQWSSGETMRSSPSFEQRKGECVTVEYSFEILVHSTFYQTECRDQAHVLCAAPVLNPPTVTAALNQQQLQCPHGHNWKTFDGDCFWETSFETNRLSWDEAESYCQGFGGHLASFHSISEEKVGLSFQYGSLSHPYWIGLKFDVQTESYKWSDGTNLDYENWAPGHPDHRDKRLRCVAMDAQNKNWTSSLCGINSWFICRVSKKAAPPPPVIPIRQPLTVCESDPKQLYFQGYCYSIINSLYTWYRAKEFCENKGASLVAIHSDEEIGFLLRALYDDKDVKGNRVWIGLNSLLRDRVMRWSDYSPLDFTYWNANEPNDARSQEKCCSMYVGNGFWNDEMCGESMGFICKQAYNVSDPPIVPSTPDPTIGNCKKGWFQHHDRCYLPVGYAKKDWVNWTVASNVCRNQGGYLVSIRDQKEQAFLSYLMQGLKSSAWIGLHDTIQSGRYYWTDHTDFRYTNWAPGEPSFFGIQEDCVTMVYGEMNSGVWRDDMCSKELPYLCHRDKDPEIPKPDYNRGLDCIYPEGWLKLDDMCFKMFPGNPMTWQEAESACQRDGAHLVSLSDTSVQAVASYLGTEVNQTFWIGLKYQKSSQQFKWLNGWPLTLSSWGTNEPTSLGEDGTCLASTADGYWGKFPCTDVMPFICQITTGFAPAPIKYTGDCPVSVDAWIPTDGDYCYLHPKPRAEWFGANIGCFSQGSYLLSLHSLEDLEMLSRTFRPGVQSVYIGLMRNEKEGFSWTDQSPVDFVNWDVDQPDDDRSNCVEMLTDTLKWRVVPCFNVKHFVCSYKKDIPVNSVSKREQFADAPSSGASVITITAIIICLATIALVIVMVHFLCPRLGRSRFFRNPFRQQSLSYVNALYNVNSASMEFQQEDNENL